MNARRLNQNIFLNWSLLDCFVVGLLRDSRKRGRFRRMISFPGYMDKEEAFPGKKKEM
jgi:hypothetical protein